jgi:hypothetical protein
MPGALLATITPVAPAFCALSALSPNSHVPRSTTAIAPAGNPTSDSQASVVVPTPSFARTTVPESPAAVGAGPNAAPAASYCPAAGPLWIVTRFGRPSIATEPTRSGSDGSLMSKTCRPSNPAPTSCPSHDDVAVAGEFHDRTSRFSQTITSPWLPCVVPGEQSP